MVFLFAAGGVVVVSGRPEQLEGDEVVEGRENDCAEGKGEAGGFAVGEAVVNAFERLSSAVAEQAEEKDQWRRHGRQPKKSSYLIIASVINATFFNRFYHISYRVLNLGANKTKTNSIKGKSKEN